MSIEEIAGHFFENEKEKETTGIYRHAGAPIIKEIVVKENAGDRTWWSLGTRELRGNSRELHLSRLRSPVALLLPSRRSFRSFGISRARSIARSKEV